MRVRMTSRRMALTPIGSPITKSGCGRDAAVLHDHRHRRTVVEGDAPAGALELAVVSVGDGVGREHAVLVQELVEHGRGRGCSEPPAGAPRRRRRG